MTRLLRAIEHRKCHRIRKPKINVKEILDDVEKLLDLKKRNSPKELHRAFQDWKIINKQLEQQLQEQ